MTAPKPETVKCKPGIICVRHQGYNCMCRCHVVERVAEPVSDPKLETRNWKQRAQVAETEVERLKKQLKDFLDGYYGATKQVDEALGDSEEFKLIDRDHWEAGSAAWHRPVIAKIERLKAELAEAQEENETSGRVIQDLNKAWDIRERQASERENQLRAALEDADKHHEAMHGYCSARGPGYWTRAALSPIPADVLKSRG